MTPERYKQIKSIFQTAVELAHSEQSAFLDRVCSSDRDLRREVEALLSSHGEVKDSIEIIASEVAATMLAEHRSGSLIGQQIGVYQIIDQIGQGGMGEVYLAQDSRLGRKVALKLLPPQFVGDKRRVSRFEQEARAVSILNHPNIVTIFDAGQVDDIYFIATEYVEGRTLRAELKDHDRLQARDALKIVLQIAEALSTAHQVGILHRDIKPENVMVRRDGIVKVLDFGLAKVAERALLDPDTGAAPPSNSCLSEAGTIFGTVKYMSPEQARGQAVDARTDVFSLGVTLYEVLTGRQPFAAEAIVDQIAMLLTAEPVPLTQLVPEIPPELQRVVQQALSKEREARQQTIDEFAGQLRQISDELQFKDRLVVSGEAPAAVADTSRPAERIPGRLSRRSLLIIAAVVIAALFGTPFVWRLVRLKTVPVAIVSEFDPVRLTTDLASDTTPSWSPDGKLMAFNSNREGQPAIFVMNSDGSRVRRVPNDLPLSEGPVWQPDGRIWFASNSVAYTMKPDGSDVARVTTSGALSPDGRQLLFTKTLTPSDWSSTELFVAEADGSKPRRLTHNKIPDTNPSWSYDGKKIAFTSIPGRDWTRGSICTINPDGSGFARLTSEQLKAGIPVWSPDGNRIAFAVLTNPQTIYVMNADGRNRMKLTDQITTLDGFAWSPDGKSIAYATDYKGNFEIYVISSDPSHQTNLTHHLAEDTSPCWSRDGKKIAFISNREGKTALYVMNPDGSDQRRVLNDVQGQGISWSPDGRRFTFVRTDKDHADLYLANADGSNVIRLTNDGANKSGPQWSPDGSRIVFAQDRDGVQQLYAIDLESKTVVRLSNSREHELLQSFSPDGKQIVFNRGRAGGVVLTEIWVIGTDGGNPRLLAAPPGKDEFTNPRFSPDGRRIAFQRLDGSVKVWDIWVMNADGSGQTRLTFAGGALPGWSPDGKRIVFTSQRRTGNSEIYVMDVLPTAGLQ